MKRLIFFPTYNEAGNVASIVNRIVEAVPDADIVIVDDSSSDGTGEVLARLARERLKVLVRPGKLGIGTAHLLAWRHALHHGYDVLVTMDGDQSHDPAEIPALLERLDAGFDLVIGSRYAAGGRSDYTGHRRWLSRGANRATRLLSGIEASEFTNSYRAFRVDRLPRIDLRRVFVSGYSFFFMTVVEAERCGLRLSEVPIHFHNRRAGRSKIPSLEIFRGIRNLAGVTIMRHFGNGTVINGGAIRACESCGCAYSKLTLPARTKTGRSHPHLSEAHCLFCGDDRI